MGKNKKNQNNNTTYKEKYASLEEIAKMMAMQISPNCEIPADRVIEVPSDGCDNHMGVGPWKVYAARCGEFTLLAYSYADGTVSITIH